MKAWKNVIGQSTECTHSDKVEMEIQLLMNKSLGDILFIYLFSILNAE